MSLSCLALLTVQPVTSHPPLRNHAHATYACHSCPGKLSCVHVGWGSAKENTSHERCKLRQVSTEQCPHTPKCVFLGPSPAAEGAAKAARQAAKAARKAAKREARAARRAEEAAKAALQQSQPRRVLYL